MREEGFNVQGECGDGVFQMRRNLPVAVAHLEPAVGGGFQRFEEHLAKGLEDQGRLRIGCGAHVGEWDVHEHHAPLAEGAVFDPRDFAVGVAHFRPLVQFHQRFERVVARGDEQAIGLERRRVVEDRGLVAQGAIFGAPGGLGGERQRGDGDRRLHRG